MRTDRTRWTEKWVSEGIVWTDRHNKLRENRMDWIYQAHGPVRTDKLGQADCPDQADWPAQVDEPKHMIFMGGSQ